MSLNKLTSNNGFAKYVSQVFLASVAAAFINFIFAPLLGLNSKGTSLGEITTLLALYAIISSLTAGMPGAVVMLLGNRPKRHSNVAKNILIAALGYCILLLVVLWFFGGFIADSLHIQSHDLLLMISLFIFFSTPYSMNLGILQYHKKFRLIGLYSLAGAFLKGVFGLYFISFLDQTPVQAITHALAITSFLLLALSLVSSLPLWKRSLQSGTDPTAFHKDVYPFFVGSTLVNMSVLLAFNMDIFMIRTHVLNESATYGAALLLPSSIFYLSQAVALVILPYITGAQKKFDITILRKFALLSPLVVFTLAGIFMVAGKALLRFFIAPELLDGNFTGFVAFATFYYSLVAIYLVGGLVLISLKISRSVVISSVAIAGFLSILFLQNVSILSIFTILIVYLLFLTGCTIRLWTKNQTNSI